jgi:DnaK suppressor protein
MDTDRARTLLIAERDEVRSLLKDTEAAGRDDRVAEVDSEAEDIEDAALALTEEGEDDAIAESLRDRLDAIERALHRLDDGTYGRSVRSGKPIPDERLEADPAAELTVEEARADEASLGTLGPGPERPVWLRGRMTACPRPVTPASDTRNHYRGQKPPDSPG